MKKVLVTERIHKVGLEILRKEFSVFLATCITQEKLIEEAANCDAVLIRSAKINCELIKNLPRLKIISIHGVGVNGIDIEAATKNKILIINTPEANINSVAEHTLCMILALSKNLVEMNQKVKQGDFGIRERMYNMEFRGKIIGIIGVGKIARCLIQKMQALDVEIIAFDPYIDLSVAKKIGVKLVNHLDEVFKVSDFITLHIPLTKVTKGVISERTFNMMKSSAYLINTSRGAIIDQEALYNALKSKKIKGAALDVFEEEPPREDNPLFKLDNVLFSPHNAAMTEEAMRAMAMQSAQGIVDYLKGKRPKNIVNFEVINQLYGI